MIDETTEEYEIPLPHRDNAVADDVERIRGALTLIAALLATKLEAGDFAAVATSGAYADLSGKPSIPAKISDLENDVLAAIAASGSYADLSGTPSIPTKLSDLDNDTGFVVTDALAPLAPKNSPALTGTPTAPTATAGTNSTQIATTAFVKLALDALIASAPGALDTLNELAAALGNDANFATTMATALAAKASLTGAETLANKTILAATINNASITDPPRFPIFNITDGPSVSLNPANGAVQRWVLGASRTAAAPAVTWGEGQEITLLVSTSAGRTLNLNMSVVWRWVTNGNTPPTLNTDYDTEISLRKLNGVIIAARIGNA